MNNKEYSIVDQTSVLDDIVQWKLSSAEVPINELSGDEAIEKSFMASSCESSIWRTKNQKASFMLSSVTIMKSMVGVGILGIPNVMRNFGIVFTLIIMIIALSLGLFASNLLLKNKNLSKRSNYSTIGYSAFHHKWIIYTVNIIIILSNLGTCLSELIIFGDTTQLLIKYFWDSEQSLPFYLNRSLWICAIGILIFPLLVVKSIEKLRFVSLTAILSISTFTILVIYNFFKVDQLPEGFAVFLPDTFKWRQAMASLPTILLAFNWQFNLFPIYKGMANTGDRKMFFAIIVGYSMAAFLYIIVGTLGFATYGQNIETNYLKSIKSSDVGPFLYVVLNLTFVISTTLTMPVLFFGGRNNFIQLVKSLLNKKKTHLTVDQYQKTLDQKPDKNIVQINLKKHSQKIRFYALTSFLFILIVVGAIFLNNLGLVFNLKGAIFCNAIQFGMPSIFYIFLVRRIKRGRFLNKKKQIQYYGVIGLFILSWIFMVTCVVSEFLK